MKLKDAREGIDETVKIKVQRELLIERKHFKI